ncbi:hypothetical protein QWZ13_04435 [Reinekea marina]|nr:hypothetical protein [Reinekea marina]MDN3648152.1 hypothetical protein [Reinekea marina]
MAWCRIPLLLLTMFSNGIDYAQNFGLGCRSTQCVGCYTCGRAVA